MKNKIILVWLVVVGILFPIIGNSQVKEGKEGIWEVNFSKAYKDAKEGKKLIFLYFTGSEWCIYCKKMDGEFLKKKEFLDFAKKDMILVKCDFGRNGPVAKEFAKEHLALMNTYSVRGFPTIEVINPLNGKVMELSYDPRISVNEFVKKLEEFKSEK